MRISDRRAQTLLQALYHTAARDENDIVANAASALAVRFENPKGNGHELNDIEVVLIRYAIAKKPDVIQENHSRRAQYKRRA